MKSWSTMLAALWRFRGFVWSSVWREFSGRYRESLLGLLWSIAQPLTMIVIFVVIFSGLMRPTLDGHEDNPFAFSIHVCAGVMAWTLFSDMLGRLTTMFIDRANLIKKSTFPRICLPAIVALSSLLQFAIILALLLLFLAVIGHWPGLAIFWVIPLVALQLAFTLALGVLLGTANVFFRDIGQLISVVLQFWFWLTPIVYTTAALPEWLRSWLPLNPMQPLVAAYQRVFLDGLSPDPMSLLPLAVMSLLLLLLAARFFLSRVGELVDEL
ncbi:MAG: ABC transporter permease [Lysobacteraceae bacterium]|nr:ABC transporter permease [Xanthomonadales bacterium]HPF74604.1 ABC transporter permease [Xanthomonadaceae bacterium]